ncbi:MAG: hypothetical protein KDJ77_18820, partial [Rhodobiaceae bacterium]|nr:hypothetical protein [Rhodobiaceae bacterium]
MTTTPTVWIDEFTTNFNSDDFRYGPVVTGLSNGNFLVTWVDNNDTVAGGFGFDIVGVIFDALGNPITGTLYLNDGFANSRDESSPVVAATSDGGFVVIWEFLGDTPNNTGFEHDIIFGRFDETGTRTIGGFVENDVSGAPSYRFPSVAVASDDSFFVTYERHDGTDDNIVGRKISSTGSVGSLQVLRQDFTLNGTNQAEDPQSPDTAVLTDGTFVTAYLQKDNNGGTNEYTVALRASTAAGANSYNLAVSSIDGALDSDPRTAGLASDKFAVVWSSGGTIQGRLYNNNGTLAGFQFTVNAFAGKSFLKPDVVGLEDGGFYAVWYNVSDNRLEGARFDSAGTQVGSTFIISFSIDASITGPQLGLTSDGRILVTWTDGTDIRTEILDPRDNPIAVEAGDGQTTARPEGSTMTGTSDNEILYGSDLIDTIDGRNGDDTIDGRGGDDNLSGGSGVDTIRGGGGADQIDGGAETDTLSGDDGDDTFVVADGHFFDNVDGGFGTDTLDHSAVTRSGDVFDFAAGQITTTFATGTPTIVSIERYLDGTGGNEIILPSNGLYVEAGIGNDIVRESSAAAADVIDLGPDSDALYINNKVISDDSFDGGAGIDWVYFSDLTFAPIAVIDIVIDLNAETLSSLGGNFVETLANFENVAGSQGEETIIGSSGQNVLRGEGGNDIISGGGGNDTIIGGPGADAIDGGTGADTANYSDSSAGINIQLQYGVIEGGDADGDTLTGIENITGTNKND